jgi:hypothetical protein
MISLTPVTFPHPACLAGAPEMAGQASVAQQVTDALLGASQAT